MSEHDDSLLAMVARKNRVLIVAAAGTGNVGDEAMLAGLLTRIGDRVPITVVSADAASTTRLHGVDAVSPSSAPLALWRSDAVIVGGGSLFSNAMGLRGRLIPVFGLVALAARKPVALAGVSIDSTIPRAIRPFVKKLTRGAAEIRVRDAASAKLLASWGVRSIIEPDLSTWIRAASRERPRQQLTEAGIRLDRPAVALCLNAVNASLSLSLLEALPRVVEALPGVQFCLVPMSQHRRALHENDLMFAREVQRVVPGLPIVAGELHPAEMLGVFSALDAAVCMRYHSLLFAHRAGIPIVGIPYAEKCRVWMAEHGIAECPTDASAIVARIESALAAAQSTESPRLAGVAQP